MAYGTILGQTPILTADGVTYDNSKTSGLITGNNVQDAIDQTVGKVKDIEQIITSSGKWVKLKEARFVATVDQYDKDYEPQLTQEIIKKYALLFVKVTGNVNCNLSDSNVGIAIDGVNVFGGTVQGNNKVYGFACGIATHNGGRSAYTSFHVSQNDNLSTGSVRVDASRGQNPFNIVVTWYGYQPSFL